MLLEKRRLHQSQHNSDASWSPRDSATISYRLAGRAFCKSQPTFFAPAISLSSHRIHRSALQCLTDLLKMTSVDAKQELQAFRIAGLPPDFYYIPNFITAEEETSILQKVRPRSCRRSTDSCDLPLCAPLLYVFLAASNAFTDPSPALDSSHTPPLTGTSIHSDQK
jgi:hypothetical protein